MEADQAPEEEPVSVLTRDVELVTLDSIQFENIFIRNYDPLESYDLTVMVSDNSQPVFEQRYFFQPGQIEVVRGVLAPGEYEVAVELDNRDRKTATCRIDDSPHRTIHVEMGNGAVSLTQGL